MNNSIIKVQIFGICPAKIMLFGLKKLKISFFIIYLLKSKKYLCIDSDYERATLPQ